MPPAVGYAIAGIASGLGMFGAAKTSAHANTDAAQIEERYSNKALAAAEEQKTYDRQQKVDYRARLDKAVSGVDARAAGLYGQRPHPQAPMTGAPAQPAMPAQATPAMVPMRSPTSGMVRPIPADQVAHWEARGAQRV